MPTGRCSDCDLLIALGVRFDDRVTGKLEAFAKHAKIIHIDVDPSEINKNKPAHIPICSDVKYALAEINKIVEPPADISAWVKQCLEWKKQQPFKFDQNFDGILQQHAIAELSRLTANRKTYITVGVGQHQMWSAQFYKFRHPRDVPLVERPGDDGLWPAGGDGRAGGSSRRAGRRYRRRRQLSDEHPGDGDLLLREAAGEGAAARQPAPGHGRAVGRPLPRQATGPTRISGPIDHAEATGQRRQRISSPSAIPTSSRSPRASAGAARPSATRPTSFPPSKR